MGHWQIIFFHKRLYLSRCTCRNDTAAYDNHGTLGLDDFLRCLCGTNEEISVRLAGCSRVLRRCGKRHFLKEQIPGNIDEYRTGTAFFCQGKSLPDGTDQQLGVLNLVIMFGNGHGHIKNICFLKSVPAQQGGIHLSGNGYHGN